MTKVPDLTITIGHLTLTPKNMLSIKIIQTDLSRVGRPTTKIKAVDRMSRAMNATVITVKCQDISKAIVIGIRKIYHAHVVIDATEKVTSQIDAIDTQTTKVYQENSPTGWT